MTLCTEEVIDMYQSSLVPKYRSGRPYVPKCSCTELALPHCRLSAINQRWGDLFSLYTLMGSEVSNSFGASQNDFGTNFVVPKCLVAEVSGSQQIGIGHATDSTHTHDPSIRD